VGFDFSYFIFLSYKPLKEVAAKVPDKFMEVRSGVLLPVTSGAFATRFFKLVEDGKTDHAARR
jgi:hypothetical protein